jgi:hypothetical protein
MSTSTVELYYSHIEIRGSKKHLLINMKNVSNNFISN